MSARWISRVTLLSLVAAVVGIVLGGQVRDARAGHTIPNFQSYNPSGSSGDCWLAGQPLTCTSWWLTNNPNENANVHQYFRVKMAPGESDLYPTAFQNSRSAWTTASSHITISTTTGDTIVNLWYLNDNEGISWDGFKFGDYPGVLGITYVCRLTGSPPTIRLCTSSGSVSPLRLIDAEIYLSTDEFDDLVQYQRQSVISHEMGHAFLLHHHCSTWNALMSSGAGDCHPNWIGGPNSIDMGPLVSGGTCPGNNANRGINCIYKFTTN